MNELAGVISTTRNFEVDEDVLPVNHARSNRADMVLPYSGTTLVCEATLNTGQRQAIAEGEPVSRHVAEVMFANDTAETIGLFVAPSIHPQSAEEFFDKNWWDPKKKKLRPVSVVPLTVEQLTAVLRKHAEHPLSVADFLAHLKSLSELRKTSDDSQQWLARTEKQHTSWLEAV